MTIKGGVTMLAEFTEFVFNNYKKDDFIDLAVKKLIEILPEETATEDFALKFLKVLKNEEIHVSNNYSVNLILHVVCRDDVRLNLTPTEIQIIEVLTRKRGEVVPYNDIIKNIWKYADDNAILKVNISNIRRKTNDIPIKSIKGVGYMIY